MIKEATQFVTFYSYKGGVGRTSALINSAVLRALEGNNVVVIDFDLEAPGIAQYVKRIDSSYDETHRAGILEYFAEVVDGAPSPSLIGRATDLSDYLKGKNGGHLWLISAGNTNDPEYTNRLEKLKWSEIFEHKFGEMMLHNLKNQVINEFKGPDYVFVDSRTGITETGGVCTRYLADKLVILTSLNEQNINGTAMVYKEFRKEGKDCVLVAANVPVGMPNGKNQLFSVRIDAFRAAFGRPPDLIVYHYPLLSLSEEVPALNLTWEADQSHPIVGLFETDPLLESYKKLARVIGIPRPSQVSFDGLLAGAANELSYLPKLTETPEEVLQLKEHYPDRYLAQLIIQAFDLLKNCVENANDPRKWRRNDYVALTAVETTITNPHVKAVIRVLKNNVARMLRAYISEGGEMNPSFEAFLYEKSLNHILLKEISQQHYDWAIDFLRRELDRLPADQHDDIACDLYNLAHCLMKIEDRDGALLLLDRFINEFNRIDIPAHAPATRANFYFCAALAYKALNLEKEAGAMRAKSVDQLSLVSSKHMIFSPIDYDRIPMEQFKKQVESAFMVDEEAPMRTRAQSRGKRIQ